MHPDTSALSRDLQAPSMSSLICCGRATAVIVLGVFVLGLVSLRQSQSDLISEPLIKQVHPIVLSADTLIAIGDLHGDLEQGYAALKLAGLVNTHKRWAGQATLVQTGDLLDRGPNSIELVQFFERLKVAARYVFSQRHWLVTQTCLVGSYWFSLSGRGSCCWWRCTYIDGQSRNYESAWRL